MSKALVIKGADFTDNSIGQVTLDVKHADSISISPSTLSLNAIGAAAQLTVTLSPADAEDAVRFSSSNEDVAVVSQNGVVTVVGCGNCSITATAGSLSASCVVTVVVKLTQGYAAGICTLINSASSNSTMTSVESYASSKLYDKNYYALVAIDESKTDLPLPYTWVVNATTSGAKSYQTDEYIESHNPWTEFPGWLVPIKLPHNCTKIKFTQLNADYGVYPLFYQYNVPSGAELTARKITSTPQIGSYSIAYETETIIDVPAGYDSFAVTWKWKPDSTSDKFDVMTEADLAKFTVEFM